MKNKTITFLDDFVSVQNNEVTEYSPNRIGRIVSYFIIKHASNNKMFNCVRVKYRDFEQNYVLNKAQE